MKSTCEVSGISHVCFHLIIECFFFSHLNIILFHIMIFMSVNPDTEKLYQAWEKMMNAKNNSHIRKDFLDYFSLSVLMTLL